jgi:hypothetical protein
MTDSDKENERTSTATHLFNLAGSVCFCAGSIFFIWSTWTNDWLRPFQYGCTIWIVGCLLFLLPLLLLPAPPLITTLCCHRNADSTRSTPTSKSYCCSWLSRSEMCLCGCLMCFLVGCAFGTTYSTEETVLRFLPPMNALFLAGSALLLADSLVVAVFAFWGSHHRTSTRTTTGSSFHKLVARMCCQCDNNDDDDDDDDVDSAPGGCATGLVVGGSYVFAGILGGYGQSQAVIRAGMFGWLVGSIPGLFETIPELYHRCMNSSRSNCCRSNRTPKKRATITKKPEATQASAV